MAGLSLALDRLKFGAESEFAFASMPSVARMGIDARDPARPFAAACLPRLSGAPTANGFETLAITRNDFDAVEARFGLEGHAAG